MENVVHKIYHLTFPCGKDYVGSTSQILKERYHRYRSDYKKSQSPICEISTQYMFNEVSMVEIDRIECPKYDSKIKILEEKWKRKLNPTLNIRKAFQTDEEVKLQIRRHNYTPKSIISRAIVDAKSMIKRHTQKNNFDMVKKWEGILEERIQSRLASQSS